MRTAVNLHKSIFNTLLSLSSEVVRQINAVGSNIEQSAEPTEFQALLVVKSNKTDLNERVSFLCCEEEGPETFYSQVAHLSF